MFLVPSLRIGGAQRQVVELAAGLQRLGWDVDVFVFYATGPLLEDLVDRGVAFTSLDKRGRWDVLGFSYRLIRELRKKHPDVVHGYLDTANLLTVIIRPLISNSRSVWGVRSSDMDFTKYDRLAGLVFRVERRLSRYANLIICNSSSGRDVHIRHGYPADRTTVVPNGIDSERFSPSDNATNLRSEWQVLDGERVVGIVARLDPKKDHVTFLRAAAEVIQQIKKVRFICVGDDPRGLRPGLEALAGDLGLTNHVVWAGSRTDMPAVFRSLDLLVSSSAWGEGFPNVVGEAMATGVPCVVTDVGDSAFVVGDTGWVCEPGDPGALADSITTALSSGEDLATRGKDARLRVMTDFSVDRLASRTSDLLAEMLRNTS